MNSWSRVIKNPESCQGPVPFHFVLHKAARQGLVPNTILQSVRKQVTHLIHLPARAPQWLPYTQNAEEREIPALQGILLREPGHRQEMLAGLSTNVSAAGACIVWLEGVGFSQREGMSRSISDSKRHSLKPATQLSFISTGRSKQLLPRICQQARSSRIFPHPTEERLQMMCPELALQTFGWFFHASPSRPQEPQAPRLGKLKLVYLPLCIWDTRI